MSSLFIRFGANAAHDIAKRSIYSIGCNYYVNRRQLSADAATLATSANRQNNANVASKNEAIVKKLQQLYDADVKVGGVVPAFKRSLLYGNKIAVKDEIGEYTYNQLFNGSKELAAQLSYACGDGNNAKVAFLCPNTAIYSIVQWACWISGQIAVPLSSRHPVSLLEYYVKDSEAQVIVTVPEYESKLKPLAESLGRKLIVTDHTFIPSVASASIIDNIKNVDDVEKVLLSSQFYCKSNAMILYTSGSTGLPKGTVISHRNLQAQTSCLSNAWAINRDDSILHVLPLNHVHGSVNALLCPLSVGAKVHMLSQFDPVTVWSTLLNVNLPSKDRVNLFMAVPTIYSLLIAEYDKAFGKNERMVEYVRTQCEKRIRLMVSGSAPLPVSVYETWHQITGHKLLERYGMTEIGMVLSNPLICDKTRDRIPGYVGAPLPDTEVKLVDNNLVVVYAQGKRNEGFWSCHPEPQLKLVKTLSNGDGKELIGELYVSGASVFVEYYNKPDETENAFEDGWFKTGDIAKYDNGMFKILGRKNVDIIKTGAYKVSALEIETHLMEHPLIVDVCVVGVSDPIWGQKIAALVVCKDASNPVTLPVLTTWCEERIATYQIPTVIKCVDELPRNAMGKLNKKEIVRDFFLTATEKTISDAGTETKA